MENNSTSDINTETTKGIKKGLTRRQVAVGAAWAAPVVALAVATPLASASVPSPTAQIGGSINVVTGATSRTATYSGGFAHFDNGATSVTSGNLTLTFTWATAGSWAITNYVPSQFTAEGWTVGTHVNGAWTFTHLPIADNATVTIPKTIWTGTGRPTINVILSSDNDDVSGTNVGTN